MPGFFDFTNPMAEINPGANSPMLDDVEQAGSYDFSANLPQDIQSQPTDGGVPYNALAAMQGIQMPQIPQRDEMGRYGVTQEQYGDAGRQSLASILRGAAGTMFNDRPDDVMAAAAGSGDIRRNALDKASLDNVNAFKLQVEAKAKELDFISKKTDIQKQQMAIDAEAMKLEDLKLKRKVAIQWGKEMAPVMSETLKKTAEAYGTDKADTIRAGFINAQSKLALGDVDGAQKIYDETIMELPHEWADKAHEDMLKASIVAANKFELGDHIVNDPAFMKMVADTGARVERDVDGMPKLVTKSEIEIEKLRKLDLQEQIAAERARAASYTNPGGGQKGVLTQDQINARVQKATASASEYLALVESKGGVLEEKDRREIEKAKAEALGDLALFGLADADPVKLRAFVTMNPIEKQKLLQQNSVRGGQVSVAPPPPNPGLPGTNPTIGPQSVVMARKGMVDVANKGPQEKATAIKALVASGDKEAKKLIDAAKTDPFFKDPKDLNNPEKMFQYLAGKIRL